MQNWHPIIFQRILINMEIQYNKTYLNEIEYSFIQIRHLKNKKASLCSVLLFMYLEEKKNKILH